MVSAARCIVALQAMILTVMRPKQYFALISCCALPLSYVYHVLICLICPTGYVNGVHSIRSHRLVPLDYRSSKRDKQLLAALNGVSVPEQEQLLLEDILFCMLGLEGQYIRPQRADDGRTTFVLSSAVRHVSLQQLLAKCLPVCESYFYCSHFVTVHTRFEHGQVHHALVAAMRALLKDYLLLVAQLESQYRKQQLTLLRLYYYIQPALFTLARLAALCSRIGHVTGGALLHRLHRLCQVEGDVATQQLYAHLTVAAAQPYLRMLAAWLSAGVIDDPYDEFIVRIRADCSKESMQRDFNDAYWDERYSLRSEDKRPGWLASYAERVLTTGKYLNVVRECGHHVQLPDDVRQRMQNWRYDPTAPDPDHAAATHDNSSYNNNMLIESSGTVTTAINSDGTSVGSESFNSSNSSDIASVIDAAYHYASRTLLTLLLDENQLLARLRSLKRYFLLEQGDLFITFMDSAEDELQKPLSEIANGKLKSLLELALRTSKAAQVDPFYEDVSCVLQTHTLLQKVDAIAAAAAGGSAASSGSSASAGLIPRCRCIHSHVYRSMATLISSECQIPDQISASVPPPVQL